MASHGEAIFREGVGLLMVGIIALALLGLPHRWLIEASPTIVILAFVAGLIALVANDL